MVFFQEKELFPHTQNYKTAFIFERIRQWIIQQKII